MDIVMDRHRLRIGLVSIGALSTVSDIVAVIMAVCSLMMSMINASQ